ncbi:hypothetical protein Tco_0254401 [Tanacetum coccineum]
MSTPSNNSQMHNDIMVVGSKERPPMLARSLYILTELVTPVVLAEGDNQGQTQVVIKETYINTIPKKRKVIDVEAEAIHIILNGIRDNI